SCVGGGDTNHEVLYTFVAPSNGGLLLWLKSSADLGLYVRENCKDPSTEIQCHDDKGGNDTQYLTVAMRAGEQGTVFVDKLGGGSSPFVLHQQFTPDTETEPNDSAQSSHVVNSDIHGTILPANDEDWYTVNVPGPSSTLTATISGLVPEACTENEIDSYL